MSRPRFLLVTYPAQGHINPSLHFANKLAATGADVTILTTTTGYSCVSRATGHVTKYFEKPHNQNDAVSGVISFAPFSDGYDDGFKPENDVNHYLAEMRRCGSEAVRNAIVSGRNEGRPYCCLVYTILIPWAGLAAGEMGLPAVLLWIQPAMVFDIYYYYFHGYEDVIRESSKRQEIGETTMTFPGLSLEFSCKDLPSFMDAKDTYLFAIPLFREEFEILEKKVKPKVLVNTIYELEREAFGAVETQLNLIGIGPLIPTSFLDGKDVTSNKDDSSKEKYIEWLNSKPKTTVVYVSFGSMAILSEQQMEEMAKGLLEFGHPFLWVIRENVKDNNNNSKLSCREELDKLGMIVPWCSQMEVLSNESVGCFVTHCGWNSTLEGLTSGVPMIGFPQWSDQGTNAKLIEDAWGTGVRVKLNKDGIAGNEEIKRCLELVMGGKETVAGDSGKESWVEKRKNAKKWKDLAREAVKEGGSSDKNLKAFVSEMVEQSGNK